MRIKKRKTKPVFTVIVNFYNNLREAKRTLHSLSSKYQNIDENLYDVIAIDNNSTQPLSAEFVKQFGGNFKYIYYKNKLPSPCKAINYAANLARTEFIVICIDGARILSPGIFNKMLKILCFDKNPFIYTINFHIGMKAQKYLLQEGYSQNLEDKLFEKTNWETDGYELFDISSIAPSSLDGYFSLVNESNCFLIKKDTFNKLGGYNESFVSKGGGFVNSHFFNLAKKRYGIIYNLLGEGTFHQFHGGAITNSTNRKEDFKIIRSEYFDIVGHEYTPSQPMSVLYFGEYRKLID